MASPVLLGPIELPSLHVHAHVHAHGHVQVHVHVHVTQIRASRPCALRLGLGVLGPLHATVEYVRCIINVSAVWIRTYLYVRYSEARGGGHVVCVVFG